MIDRDTVIDRLARVEENTKGVKEHLNNQDDKIERILRELSELKNWRSKVSGYSAAMGAVVGVAVSWLMQK